MVVRPEKALPSRRANKVACLPTFRNYLEARRNFKGKHFWARGYCVSTVGLDEQMIREYIRTRNRKRNAKSNSDWRGSKAPSGGFHHTTRFAGGI